MRATIGAIFSILLGSALCGCTGGTLPPAPQPTHPASLPQRQHAARSEGANFDFYLLNLSWSPEFCHSHPTASECAAHSTFILHGLWPERADGSYPQHCSSAPGPADPSQYRDVYPEAGLLAHEWQTHGTCSGLGPDAYFSSVRSAFHSIRIPAAFQGSTSQAAYPPERIKAMFAASNPGVTADDIVVSCGNNFLTAVEVCLDKQLHPTSCGQVRTCRANVVKVPPPM